MLTVPQAAKRIGRNPETVRRWIREGRLRASKVGTQHVIEEADLADALSEADETLATPAEWSKTSWGTAMPNVVTAIRRSREGR